MRLGSAAGGPFPLPLPEGLFCQQRSLLNGPQQAGPERRRQVEKLLVENLVAMSPNLRLHYWTPWLLSRVALAILPAGY